MAGYTEDLASLPATYCFPRLLHRAAAVLGGDIAMGILIAAAEVYLDAISVWKAGTRSWVNGRQSSISSAE